MASVYRLAASMSPGIDGLRSRVEFHRRGRFDATVTLHDGRSFGVVRQGLALRRRSLYDRLRAIAEYDYSRRPGTVLVLVPSMWELRRTARFCIDNDLRDCFHRRGVQGRARKTGPSPLVRTHGGCSDSRTPRWRASGPTAAQGEGLVLSRRSGSGHPYPAQSGWRRLRRPSASAQLRSGRSTSLPTIR